jgi:putative nucleotidyltransferase with HDIG domain
MAQTNTGVTKNQTAQNLEAMVANVKDLPPLPVVIMKALELTMSPDSSVRDLQLVISQDQALSAKILRIVNSAMYSLRREVSTLSHAVSVLGMETVQSIIMAASVEKVLQNSRDLGTKLMSEHSWGAALTARIIARRVRYENPEEAMVCGLMHDIGKPVILQNYQTQYVEIINEVYRGSSSFHELELMNFGFSHAHVGAFLARKWNFPPQMSIAVGYHHNPTSAPNFKQLACIVGLANQFMVQMCIGIEKNKDIALEKLSTAEFLKMDGQTIEALINEIQAVLQAPTMLKM